VAERLALPQERWRVSFQSRFGRAEWMQPYTDKTLRQWAQEGIKEVDVVCPGFAADCLETLEEIAMLNRDAFLAAGGTRLSYIPALNDRPDHIDALVEVLNKHIQAWPEARADYDAGRAAAERQASLRLARALGSPR